jgi:nucleotidyltransferase substrate binding protein (TIGR01987 family)
MDTAPAELLAEIAREGRVLYSPATRRLDVLEQALDRLEEALAVPESAPLAIDGTIRRFNFVVDFCCNALQTLVERSTSPASVNSTRSAIEAAYATGWINDEAAWLDLIDMRNATTYTYCEAMAKDIYRRIRLRTPMIRAALPELRK